MPAEMVEELYLAKGDEKILVTFTERNSFTEKTFSNIYIFSTCKKQHMGYK
jgi:hypothetical protein